MRNYLFGIFRSLLHLNCNFPRPNYPRYKLLFDNFLKQWNYIKNKGSIPSFDNNTLGNIFQSLIKQQNKNDMLFENEWHEIVCYVIFIASFYETEYSAYLEKKMSKDDLSPSFHMSTDCLWNTNIVHKIVKKYKKYPYSLDKRYHIKDLWNDEDYLLEFWGAKHGFLRIIITEEPDVIEHVFSVQKIGHDSYRLIETNVRSHLDLRYSFFESKSYGRPYSWDHSTSSEMECKKFIEDNIKTYDYKQFIVTFYIDFL